MAFVMRAHSLITMLKHHAGCKGKRSKYIFTSPELSDAAPKSGPAIMRVQQTERHIRSSASSKHCCCLSSSSSLELLRCHPTEGIEPTLSHPLLPTFPSTNSHFQQSTYPKLSSESRWLVLGRSAGWLPPCLSWAWYQATRGTSVSPADGRVQP
jgi:hypothetical protein